LGISAIATSIAFLAMDLLSATASFLNFWVPTVGVLSIAAILGIRTNLAVFVSTSASGFIAYLMWQVFELQSKLGVSSLFPSTIVSVGVFTCAHLVSNFIKKYQGQVLERINVFNHLANASQRHTDKFGIQYKLFGVIAALNYIVPVFVFPNQIYQDKLALVLYLVSGLLAILLVLKDGLLLQHKQYFSLYWHITLCISLPCLASYMLFASNGELYVNLILSTLFLALLVDWVVFIILFSIGTLAGYVLYAVVHPGISISAILMNFDPYFAVYICVFGVVPTLVFINKRQHSSENLPLDDEGDAQVQHIAICPPKIDDTPVVSTNMHVSNSTPLFHNDLHLVDYKNNKEKSVHLNTGKVRALVVDNDHMYLNILGLYLEDFGYQVEKITSGKSALDYLNTMNFDLILLNTTTSDMPGFEVLIQFKRNSAKQIPVIIQTKLEEGNMLDKFLQVGAAGYISKPYIKNNIKAVIDRVLHEPDMAEAA
jgi:CheY-like chemotaxis protein